MVVQAYLCPQIWNRLTFSNLGVQLRPYESKWVHTLYSLLNLTYWMKVPCSQHAAWLDIVHQLSLNQHIYSKEIKKNTVFAWIPENMQRWHIFSIVRVQEYIQTSKWRCNTHSRSKKRYDGVTHIIGQINKLSLVLYTTC